MDSLTSDSPKEVNQEGVSQEKLWNAFLPLWKLALCEDLGNLDNLKLNDRIQLKDLKNDITSYSTISAQSTSSCELIAKENIVACGLPLISQMLAQFFTPTVPFNLKLLGNDGDLIDQGKVIATLQGNSRMLLALERTLLNCLQHLSGIATLTHQWVKQITPNTFKLFDTRKTLPAYRYLEKYAVKTGGGENHRYGLFDGYMAKDNHIDSQTIKPTSPVNKRIQTILSSILAHKNATDISARGNRKWVEIECRNQTEVSEVIKFMSNTDNPSVDVIMLDNFTHQEIITAVPYIKKNHPQCQIEISGEINQEKLVQLNTLYQKIAHDHGVGFERVSSGFITHSSPASDISLNFLHTSNT